MKILVLGASGIIGSHMQLDIPAGVEAVFARNKPSPGYVSFDATKHLGPNLFDIAPDVVVNLAGESNTDYVEAIPTVCERVNIELPDQLGVASHQHRFRFIHVSSQAVFSGENGPYSAKSKARPVNEYGVQKAAADSIVLFRGGTIIRPTFVLGVRPDPSIGRPNPIEQMMSGQPLQVIDRFFSVSFAPDVAHCIWQEAINPTRRRIIHAGVPHRTSRLLIASDLGLDVEAIEHDVLADRYPGIAPRPFDTTYAEGDYRMGYYEGLADCKRRWEARMAVAA